MQEVNSIMNRANRLIMGFISLKCCDIIVKLFTNRMIFSTTIQRGFLDDKIRLRPLSRPPCNREHEMADL